MAQAYAENYNRSDERSSDNVGDLRNKATEIADDVSKEARTLVDQVVAYTKANPLEATAIAAGVAFIAGSLILAPRLMQSRQERDFDRLLRQAYDAAERARADSTTWNRLTDWVCERARHQHLAMST